MKKICKLHCPLIIIILYLIYCFATIEWFCCKTNEKMVGSLSQGVHNLERKRCKRHQQLEKAPCWGEEG